MSTERIEHVEPLSQKLERERDTARREALSNQEQIEPSDEEKKNGWTTKTLTAYLAEREAGQSLAVDVNSLHRRQARRPNSQNSSYRVHRWRE